MADTMWKTGLILIFVGAVSSLSLRTVTTQPWPNCADSKECKAALMKGDVPNVVYTKASTPNHDDLHYVFSTKAVPTIIMARTTKVDSKMVFDWEKILNPNVSLEDAISFQPKPTVEYKFGIAFTKLIEYDDVHDDVDLDEARKRPDVLWNIRPFTDIIWEKLKMDKDIKNSFTFNTTDDNFSPELSRNGSLSFTFRTPSEGGRIKALPSQKYSVNETIFEFLMDNFTPNFNHSRFALEIVAVSLEKSEKMSVETIKTIDDEYSPGVFLLTNWLTNPAAETKFGFIQWKPVCYTGTHRGRKTSSKVKNYDLLKLNENERTMLNSSLLAAVFGEELFDGQSDIQRMNISFGLFKDGFYVKNNYTVWNAALGYGEPPKDTISLTVIIIIAAGLGVPVVLILFGGIFTIYRNLKKKPSNYERIQGDNSGISQSEPVVN